MSEWRFEVNFEGGQQPDGEWDGAHFWAIYNGPDDVVLVGMADEDPTAVLAELVAMHNGQPAPTPGPTREQVRDAIFAARDTWSPGTGSTWHGAVSVDKATDAVLSLFGSTCAPPAESDEPIDWTCPACRRGDHIDCLNAGPGVCRCAAEGHASAADGET